MKQKPNNSRYRQSVVGGHSNHTYSYKKNKNNVQEVMWMTTDNGLAISRIIWCLFQRLMDDRYESHDLINSHHSRLSIFFSNVYYDGSISFDYQFLYIFFNSFLRLFFICSIIKFSVRGDIWSNFFWHLLA